MIKNKFLNNKKATRNSLAFTTALCLSIGTLMGNHAFAMETEKEEYSRVLVLYKSALNIDDAARLLEDAIKLKSQAPVPNTNTNTEDINFYDEYTKLALAYRIRGSKEDIEQAIYCETLAEKFRTKSWVEWGADNVYWGWSITTNAVRLIYENQEPLMKGIETVKNIVYVLSAIKTVDNLSNSATTTSNAATTIPNSATTIPNSKLPGGETSAPKVDSVIKKEKGCKPSKR